MMQVIEVIMALLLVSGTVVALLQQQLVGAQLLNQQIAYTLTRLSEDNTTERNL